MLPLLSRTVQVTVFVPSGKLAGASFATVSAPPQLSLATRLPKLTLVAEHAPLSAATVTSAGQVVISGGWLSVTITVCKQVAVFPPASCTVQVTVLVPTGKLAGASLVTISAPPQLSLATKLPKVTLVAEHVPSSATTFTCAGQVVITGGWVSVTTTV